MWRPGASKESSEGVTGCVTHGGTKHGVREEMGDGTRDCMVPSPLPQSALPQEETGDLSERQSDVGKIPFQAGEMTPQKSAHQWAQASTGAGSQKPCFCFKQDMMAFSCNLISGEVETCRSLWLANQSG